MAGFPESYCLCHVRGCADCPGLDPGCTCSHGAQLVDDVAPWQYDCDKCGWSLCAGTWALRNELVNAHEYEHHPMDGAYWFPEDDAAVSS